MTAVAAQRRGRDADEAGDASRHRVGATSRRVVAAHGAHPGPAGLVIRHERLRTLEESLERVVFGQAEAVHAVAQAIKRSRAGLGQPERPAGCFLFTGPTGVGKTELARQLASSSATSSSAST